MTPEDILKHEPIVLTPEQRQSFSRMDSSPSKAW